MTILLTVAAISLLQVPDAELMPVDVAVEELAGERNDAAITRIEANQEIDQNDPARLMNLGIAYAREGRTAEARALFEAVMRQENRVRLETNSGDWVDSKHLAHRALALLDNGELDSRTRMAAR